MDLQRSGFPIMQPSPSPRPPAPDLVPRVKVWLEQDGEYAFGLGICEILQAVGRTGSIKRAAQELGKSYRHIWARIKKAEQAFGQPLVEAHVGGSGSQRSSLTPVAQSMVVRFLRLRARMIQLLEQEFGHQFDPGAPTPES